MTATIKKQIKSARLTLTAITQSELALYQSLYGDPVTMQFIGPCYDPAESAVLFQRCLKRTEQANSGWHFFSVQLAGQLQHHAQHEQQKAIGFITLIAKKSNVAPFEFGIVLSTARRGLGYAAEALTALFLHCFCQANIPALLARVNPNNNGMLKHIRQFGFVAAPAEPQQNTPPEKNAELTSYVLYPSAENIALLNKLSQSFLAPPRAHVAAEMAEIAKNATVSKL
ncbi:MAG: GNAT family N-acetyltransferase [Gammaproteobacteria bacterium]|nr:GNAT family N-acetyltransferase [Gammaproteobacteria bacterium]